tara:strand:+ start:150 stop:1115 length:966 start_codon:yes stop_codon:yes gene_type:complete
MSTKTENKAWVTPDVVDRALGCIYGLLVGDALGAPFEFLNEGTYDVPEEGEYARGGMHDVSPGEWTDDGAMALALADSLATVGWDRSDQLERYCNWMYHGEYSSRGVCFDIGRTTTLALDTYAETHDPDLAGRPVGRRSAGNGSIMRLAPVPIWCALNTEDPEEAVEKALKLGAASSTTTHGHSRCMAAAGQLSMQLCVLIRGLRDIGEFSKGKDPRREGSRGVSGFVGDTLDAALWCFNTPTGVHAQGPVMKSGLDRTAFSCVVRKAVSLGGDTDTVGAVAGQLAGAAFGIENIPPGWLLGLPDDMGVAEGIINRLVKGE